MRDLRTTIERERAKAALPAIRATAEDLRRRLKAIPAQTSSVEPMRMPPVDDLRHDAEERAAIRAESAEEERKARIVQAVADYAEGKRT